MSDDTINNMGRVGSPPSPLGRSCYLQGGDADTRLQFRGQSNLNEAVRSRAPKLLQIFAGTLLKGAWGIQSVVPRSVGGRKHHNLSLHLSATIWSAVAGTVVRSSRSDTVELTSDRAITRSFQHSNLRRYISSYHTSLFRDTRAYLSSKIKALYTYHSAPV
ncbi:hypothetical protein T439DRAFT_354624 [Meredithblackwellia eburnea MCA 4105]